MYIGPNSINRLKEINLYNFKNGETILFCFKCDWQQTEPYGMNPKCPDCQNPLHYTTMSDELKGLVTNE